MLTNDNYFSREMLNKYMSVSQYKAFEKCQSMAMAELRGKYKQEKTTALLVGSYVDAYFEGTLDQFILDNPSILKRDGTLKSDYLRALDIIARINRDKLFTEFMSGQKQVIMTGEISGVPIKIKIDSLHDDKIVDLKIMKDLKPIYVPENGRLAWFEAWRYDLQGAVYQEIVRQNTGKVLPFYLAVATKENVPDIEIIHINQDILDFELDRFKENVSVNDAVKRDIIPPERCEKCDFCKATKVLTSPIESEEYIDE